MRPNIKIALVALAFAAAPLAAISPQAAAQSVDVTVNPSIAFGYSDGYWDRDHQWHKWRDAREEEAWRKDNAAHFYQRRHDEDQDSGWRASDQWWAHH